MKGTDRRKGGTQPQGFSQRMGANRMGPRLNELNRAVCLLFLLDETAGGVLGWQQDFRVDRLAVELFHVLSRLRVLEGVLFLLLGFLVFFLVLFLVVFRCFLSTHNGYLSHSPQKKSLKTFDTET